MPNVESGRGRCLEMPISNVTTIVGGGAFARSSNLAHFAALAHSSVVIIHDSSHHLQLSLSSLTSCLLALSSYLASHSLMRPYLLKSPNHARHPHTKIHPTTAVNPYHGLPFEFSPAQAIDDLPAFNIQYSRTRTQKQVSRAKEGVPRAGVIFW